MCGISGIFSANARHPELQNSLSLLTDAMLHRGPDGAGYEVSAPFALGHRRLAIIDPEGGQQPMWDNTRRYCITYNGELYNYKEIRNDLQQRGHRFNTHCDTEVVLYAFIEWGEKCVERFRGMYAFGVLDSNERTLFLVRDPLGIKPLYYLQFEGFFAFASEITPLVRISPLQLEVDLAAIEEYLLLTYISAPRTAFKQIRALPAGHSIKLNNTGRLSAAAPYWQMKFEPDFHISRSHWIESLDDVLGNSVNAHLVSDVDFGAFLSGGLDSSCVVGYMSSALNSQIKTFNIGFSESGFDESPHAELIAKKFHTKHYSKVVGLDRLPEILPKLVKHYGQPFGDNSAIPTAQLCQLASREVKMVLSGDGADEILGGYDRYFRWMEFNYRKQSAMEALQKGTYEDFLAKPPLSARGDFNVWSQHLRNFEEPARQLLWGEKWNSVNRLDRVPMVMQFEEAALLGPGHQVQFADIHTYLTDNICVKVDIASMMHSLEVRTPLTDIRVYETLGRIPEHFNLRPELDGRYTGKHLLKSLICQKFGLPNSFVNRKKAGFVVPLDAWFGAGSPLVPWASQRLLGTDSQLSLLFSNAGLKTVLQSCRGRHIYTLLFLEEWLRQTQPSIPEFND
jgi:asparagine synthase (glutamine-hydrolysing)